MNYQTFEPSHDLAPLIKCYWTLEVPAEASGQKQRIVPDGCFELAFILGDDIKRYTTEEAFILQPRAMVLGQITEPFFIEPTGYVNSFAVRFYPYGFSNFVKTSFKALRNKETPIDQLFERKMAHELEEKIIQAESTSERIKIVEDFLLKLLKDQDTIDDIVKSTVEALFQTKGSQAIHNIMKDDGSSRRSMERKFMKQIGISPKQLGKIIRLQSALKLLLAEESDSLTKIAYEAEYYDQAHFTKDFKEFTGVNPKEYLNEEEMKLSSLIYSSE